ncbi:MAG TPA: DNA glycosylase [Opitutaceae bacterium]
MRQRLAGWSRWTALDWSPTDEVLAEILDGGPAFRWTRDDDDSTWTGVWEHNVARLRQGATGCVEWSAPATIAKRVGTALPVYLALDCDWDALVATLPVARDPHLARCIVEFPGLRLLAQPFGETLLAFICSATKQIVQIRRMLEALALRFGDPIAGGFHALPSWERLATIPEAELRACQLGFRARHVHGTATFLAARPGWLEETRALPYADARERLIELPGVGPKIADCALLFGAGRLEAFPVDVWVMKALARHYVLKTAPSKLAARGREAFGPCAGLAQQYLFSWERRRRK